MGRAWTYCLALFFLCVLSAPVFAAPAVYPVRQVIGFDDSSLQEKAPAFARWVGERGLPALSEEFAAAFRKEFGAEAVDDITASSKHRVMVASLHLVRASEYSVPKIDGTAEIHLPITLSIVFTNPATGEVIYSFTTTSYASARVAGSEAPEEVAVQLQKAIAANYGRLLPSLVQKAKKDYQPAQIGAAVVKVWKGLFLLDKGTKAGIARDDDLTDAAGNVIKVRYAAEDYAVAEPLLVAKVEKGQSFSKFANQSLIQQLKKPRVLSMSGGWGDDQLKAVANFFESELSKESAFTLLPVNESLQTVLAAVARDTAVGQYQVSNARSLPDYLIKFSYSPARAYELKLPGKNGFRVYEQHILGELLDRQGRIVYSASGQNEIRDENVAGMVFDLEARREILLKNAVADLAGQFSRSIRFSRFTLPVKRIEGTTLHLEDGARQLRPGQTVTLFRPLGRVEGISGDVVVPIWDAEVKGASGGRAVVQTLLPLAAEKGEGLRITKEDMVILESISAESADKSDTAVAYCSDLSSKLGDVAVDDFPVVSRAFGYQLPFPLYDNDRNFMTRIRDALKYGGFRDTLQLGGVDTSGRCLLPVQRTFIEGRQCSGSYCNAEVRLAAGYRLYSGQDKKTAASETRLTIKQISESAFEPVIQSEVSRSALKLLKDNVMKVRY